MGCPLCSCPRWTIPTQAIARGTLPPIIPADVLRRCCHIGYARGVCERAAGSEADAMRFLVKSYRGGGTVEVAWSIERNHHPVAVGSFEVTETMTTERPLERQARACAEAYLRQIGAAA